MDVSFEGITHALSKGFSAPGLWSLQASVRSLTCIAEPSRRATAAFSPLHPQAQKHSAHYAPIDTAVLTLLALRIKKFSKQAEKPACARVCVCACVCVWCEYCTVTLYMLGCSLCIICCLSVYVTRYGKSLAQVSLVYSVQSPCVLYVFTVRSASRLF